MKPYRGLTKKGKWVYGWYIEIDGLSFIEYQNDHNNRCTVEVIPESVGQKTGLKDKKRTKEYPEGQEIYEGDIIEYFQFSRICSKCAHREKIINAVKFNALGVTLSSYRIIDPQCDISELEVIGNIHQNPELMEEPK